VSLSVIEEILKWIYTTIWR